MPDRSAETASYAGEMAKVEINLPDDLLRRVDNAAEDAGETREAFLRRIAEEEVVKSEAAFRRRIEEMLGPPVSMGGDSAQIIREMRDQRLPPAYRDEPDDD
jgi:predicted DNA-binding protein